MGEDVSEKFDVRLTRQQAEALLAQPDGTDAQSRRAVRGAKRAILRAMNDAEQTFIDQLIAAMGGIGDDRMPRVVTGESYDLPHTWRELSPGGSAAAGVLFIPKEFSGGR